MFQVHQLDAARNVVRLLLVQRQRPTRARGAKPATAGAYIAHDHESSRSPAPTLRLVGAHSAAAYGMQRVSLDDTLHLCGGLVAAKSDLQPIRFSQYDVFVMHLRHLSSLFFQLAQIYEKIRITPAPLRKNISSPPMPPALSSDPHPFASAIKKRHGRSAWDRPCSLCRSAGVFAVYSRKNMHMREL